MQELVIILQSAIPTPSEVAESSRCMGDQPSVSENDEDNYEEVEPNTEDAGDRSYQRVEQNSDNNEPLTEADDF